MTTFYVEIEMGNAAMMNNTDVRSALQYVIGYLDCNYGGTVRDVNGNVVGKYGFKGKYPLKADPYD
jgi:hypothetical protein